MNSDEVKRQERIRQLINFDQVAGFITRWSIFYSAIVGAMIFQLTIIGMIIALGTNLLIGILIGVYLGAMAGIIIGAIAGGIVGLIHGTFTMMLCRALYPVHNTRYFRFAVTVVNLSIPSAMLFIAIMYYFGHSLSIDSLLIQFMLLTLPYGVCLEVSRKFLKWWLRSEP